jgi:hypothetical protein
MTGLGKIDDGNRGEVPFIVKKRGDEIISFRDALG